MSDAELERHAGRAQLPPPLLRRAVQGYSSDGNPIGAATESESWSLKSEYPQGCGQEFFFLGGVVKSGCYFPCYFRYFFSRARQRGL
jgi:hypothetical protein